MAGIANSITRPDWVNPIYDPGQVPIPTEPQDYDFALVVNPITLGAFTSNHHIVDELGDYILLSRGPGHPTQELGNGLPDGWEPIDNSQLLHVTDGETIFFAFSDPPQGIGSVVGIARELEVQPNSCYVVSAHVQDWYQTNDQPWRFLQQLVVNDVVLWSHDVGDIGSCQNEINHFLMPTSSHLRVQIRTLALGQPHDLDDWRSLSLTGVQDLQLQPCGQ
jgi:hypothetical protein